MRRPYEIYKKYRQVQKRHLAVEIKERTAVCPGNCVHNQVCHFNDARADVPLCMYGQVAGEAPQVAKLVVCNKVDKARSCPYYTAKYPSEASVIEAMGEELKDPEVRSKRYPDVEALRWVMEKDLHAFRQLPPNIWVKFLFRVIVLLEAIIKRTNKQIPKEASNMEDAPS